jgi:hypothetical protein
MMTMGRIKPEAAVKIILDKLATFVKSLSLRAASPSGKLKPPVV